MITYLVPVKIASSDREIENTKTIAFFLRIGRRREACLKLPFSSIASVTDSIALRAVRVESYIR